MTPWPHRPEPELATPGPIGTALAPTPTPETPREIVRDERGKPIGIRVKAKEPAATSVADNVIVEIIPDGH